MTTKSKSQAKHARSLPDALATFRSWLRWNVPGVTVTDMVLMLADGKQIVLPFPDRASTAPETIPDPGGLPPSRSSRATFQLAILESLEGRAMRTDPLGAAVGDRSRLFKPGGLKELMAHWRVRHHKRLGFYRPDAPPVELTKAMEREAEVPLAALTGERPVSTTEQIILQALTEAPSGWVTGQKLAEACRLPRSTMFNAVLTNLAEASVIESSTRHGYRLKTNDNPQIDNPQIDNSQEDRQP